MFGQLLRFRLRRDRTQLIVWGVAMFLIMLIVVRDVGQTFGTDAVRASTLRLLMTTPAILMFRGTPQGAGAGEFTAFLGITFIALLAGLMSTFMVVRNTRAEEERGQSELVAATRAARTAPTIAVVAHLVIANAIVTIALWLGCVAGGLPSGGSLVLAVACGQAGLAFGGIALVFAQLFPSGRAANAWSATLVVVMYFVRGIGDAAGTPHPATLTFTPAWPLWISPIGWAQATHPFEQNRLWPLLLGVALFVVCVFGALAIQDRRDVGLGVLAERKSRATAGGLLSSPFGLALRLERGTLIGWVVAIIAGALLFGALSGALIDELGSASSGTTNILTDLGGKTGTLLESFANIGALFTGLLAAALCAQGAIRLRQEESAGGAEAVLSTASGRVKWMLSYLAVTGIGAIVALFLGGVVVGASANGNGGSFGTYLAAWLWQIPAVLIFLGIVALVFAVLPQATAIVGWGIFIIATILGFFGPLIGLADWTQKISPLAHTPAVLLGNPDYTGGWVMAIIAVVLIAASVYLFRLRDTKPTA